MLTKPDKVKLFTLMGNYPNAMALKEGKLASAIVGFEFADVKVSNTAFKPLVREARFDLAEVAIVTFLQARTYGKPYALIPATVVGRGQLHTIAYNPERGALKPSELNGKTVGVRAYTQTTGVWVRGILAEDYGVDLNSIKWVTFEEGHVAEYDDPPNVRRAPERWRRLGLEWLYRLCAEPSRWRRQLALPAFVALALRERLSPQRRLGF